MNVANFSGVWRRTMLYEPIGTIGPEEELRKDVIWVQAVDGNFIDIRYCAGESQHDKMKSFAGTGSYDATAAHFTWTRKFDFRAPGSPDIGLMKVLKGSNESPEQLEEDGVLPGDDYREIWDRLSAPKADSDCTARLICIDTAGNQTRKGLFLVVGDWFALVLSRSEQESGLHTLQSAFSAENSASTMADASKSAYVWAYVAAMGNTSTWRIEYALHPELRGTQLPPADGTAAAHTLGALFDPLGGWEWHYVTGTPPLPFRQCTRCVSADVADT
jgi:hypothetical protein